MALLFLTLLNICLGDLKTGLNDLSADLVDSISVIPKQSHEEYAHTSNTNPTFFQIRSKIDILGVQLD